MTRTFRLPASFVAEPTHASLIRDLVQYLTLRGWLVIQTPAGGIIGEPGVADLIALRRGSVLFVEAKMGRNKLSTDQLRFRGAVREHGCYYLEARSLDDVRAAGV
jgi:hypothetical protein